MILVGLPLPPVSQPPTFRKINAERVFHCLPCQKCWMGDQLWKTPEGKYVCFHCNGLVQDVTEAPLGQAFLHLVHPTPKAA